MTRALYRCNRSLLAVTAALAVANFVSCTPEDRVPEPPRPALRDHVYVPGSIATRLTRDVSGYTAQQLRELANQAGDWRMGENSLGLVIEQAPAAHTFDPVYAGEFGTVIARITNNRTSRDSAFQAAPGATVYLIVFPWNGPIPGDTALPGDTVLYDEPVAPLKFVHVLGDSVTVPRRTGTYRICRHHVDTPATLPARFGGCDHPVDGASSADARFQSAKTVGRFAGPRGPAAAGDHMLTHQGGSTNVHCTQGCCTGKT
jgi:hypothetical protein